MLISWYILINMIHAFCLQEKRQLKVPLEILDEEDTATFMLKPKTYTEEG